VAWPDRLATTQSMFSTEIILQVKMSDPSSSAASSGQAGSNGIHQVSSRKALSRLVTIKTSSQINFFSNCDYTCEKKQL